MDYGLILTSLKVKTFAIPANIQVWHIRDTPVLWIVVLQQLII